MKYFKKLIGDRIYLSPRNSEDIEIFTEWLNDFETTDYLGRSGILTTLEGERMYLNENSTPEASFVIVTIDDNKMIGTVSLESINHINRCATLGIFIGDKDFRSKGYGTETIKKVLLDNLKIDIDCDVCIISAYWHDVGRLFTGEGYEKLSAEMLRKEMTEKNYSKELINDRRIKNECIKVQK